MTKGFNSTASLIAIIVLAVAALLAVSCNITALLEDERFGKLFAFFFITVVYKA